MSFSSKVKFELTAIYGASRHCQIAELAAIVNCSGIIIGTGEKLRILFHSDSELVLIKLGRLVQSLFAYTPEKVFIDTALKELTVSDSIIAEKILTSTGLLTEAGIEKKIDAMLIKDECCKKAYIRGEFLCTGSVSDPEKAYHLEFSNDSEELALGLSSLINSFGLKSKIIKRVGNYIVYVKEADQIVDVLNITGSHNALFEYENQRVQKNVNNYINRKINCFTANDDKSITAAVSQTSDILLLKDNKLLDSLTPQLREIAYLRLEFPELSLKELGEKLSPPLSKSGVNHRLRKLKSLANKYNTKSIRRKSND